ncbi:MAG TPA: MlaE family lipid ABC transporter permease subunit [Steroidobacteraceae bacterium]|nr:MlaE family lipid ABC transporter permease subunit [Steroidobacteraceae bacterium]
MPNDQAPLDSDPHGPLPACLVRASREADRIAIQLSGDWHARQFGELEAQLAAIDLDGARQLQISATEARVDMTSAWLLRDFLRRAREAGVTAQFAGAPPPMLQLVDRTLTGEIPEHTRHVEWPTPGSAVEGLGRQFVRGLRTGLAIVGFVGHASTQLMRGVVQPRHLRLTSITRHVYDTGITAIPIVALIAFLVSVILAYLGAQELQQFGANVFVADLVTIGVLRELGVLLTAVIIAGRSGSAFTAEIGAMRLNEEVDALLAIGLDPFELLVLPRLIGLVIALPLLTVMADIVGLTGGGLLCHVLLHMPLLQYLSRVHGAIASTTFWVGLIKAPVFAALIAMAGCFNGMRVRRSSRELGRLTTRAVVQAIFGVILADALFAVLFLNLNI